MGPVGTPMGTKFCPFVSHLDPARIQSGRRGCTMLSRGKWLNDQSRAAET